MGLIFILAGVLLAVEKFVPAKPGKVRNGLEKDRGNRAGVGHHNGGCQPGCGCASCRDRATLKADPAPEVLPKPAPAPAVNPAPEVLPETDPIPENEPAPVSEQDKTPQV